MLERIAEDGVTKDNLAGKEMNVGRFIQSPRICGSCRTLSERY